MVSSCAITSEAKPVVYVIPFVTQRATYSPVALKRILLDLRFYDKTKLSIFDDFLLGN